MKFEREDTPTIMDGQVIRWTSKTGWVNKPEISASRNGVCISGAWPTINNSEDLQDVKEKLADAFEFYLMLRAGRKPPATPPGGE